MSLGPILCLVMALAGCGGAGSDAPPETETTPAAAAEGSGGPDATSASPLSNTEWRLVEIQSMDDAQGITRPEYPSRFTLNLHGDGRVSLRLDCNRATGTWWAEAGADPASGRFELGPLAANRALCPPPRLDERITAQAEYVRSYLLEDGRLYLSLMADGGIQVWEPLEEVPFRTEPDSALEAAILRAAPGYTREITDLGTGVARYVYGRVDLNDDGSDETFAYLLGSSFCGTGGCTLLLFTRAADGYEEVAHFPISRLPVIVSSGATGGWKDLIRRESGGGVEPSYVRHAWDGQGYVERERLPGDAAPEGVRYLAGDLTFDVGIPLDPPAG